MFEEKNTLENTLSNRATVQPELAVDCTAMKLPTEESSKFLPSNFHLYFKSRANFVGCRGSQMPIKECKMFYRSFETHFRRCKLFYFCGCSYRY